MATLSDSHLRLPPFFQSLAHWFLSTTAALLLCTRTAFSSYHHTPDFFEDISERRTTSHLCSSIVLSMCCMRPRPSTRILHRCTFHVAIRSPCFRAENFCAIFFCHLSLSLLFAFPVSPFGLEVFRSAIRRCHFRSLLAFRRCFLSSTRISRNFLSIHLSQSVPLGPGFG